jgi:hypothetical protein
LLAVATACLAVSAVAVAIADTGFIKDPAGDVGSSPAGVPKNDLDLIRATYGHHAPGRLVHRVFVAGTVRNPDTAAKPHSGLRSNFPFLFIDVPGGPNFGCDYAVIVNGKVLGPNDFHQGAHLFTCGPNSHEVAPAKVTKVAPNRLRYAFSKRRIGNPTAYGFQFSFEGTSDNSFDAVPDNGFKRHVLQ